MSRKARHDEDIETCLRQAYPGALSAREIIECILPSGSAKHEIETAMIRVSSLYLRCYGFWKNVHRTSEARGIGGITYLYRFDPVAPPRSPRGTNERRWGTAHAEEKVRNYLTQHPGRKFTSTQFINASQYPGVRNSAMALLNRAAADPDMPIERLDKDSYRSTVPRPAPTTPVEAVRGFLNEEPPASFPVPLSKLEFTAAPPREQRELVIPLTMRPTFQVIKTVADGHKIVKQLLLDNDGVLWTAVPFEF